jgi:hypothetical protein
MRKSPIAEADAPESDEDGRKAQHEGGRRQEHLTPRAAVAGGARPHFLERQPRDEREIPGNQRQHTRRHEGEKAGHEGGKECYLIHRPIKYDARRSKYDVKVDV